MSGHGLESLQAFQTWFFSPAGPGVGRIPLCEPTRQKDGITALTLYRRNGYQAELALIPPGQHYEICLPKGVDLGFVFLGGSFHYASSPSPEERALHPSQQTVYDEYREEIGAVMARPDYLEQPHPSRSTQKNPPFIPLVEGMRITFHAPDRTGIILLLGQYTTDRTHSWLEHVTPLPLASTSTEATP